MFLACRPENIDFADLVLAKCRRAAVMGAAPWSGDPRIALRWPNSG